MPKLVKATLEDDFHAQVKSRAALEGISMQDLITRLLDYWLQAYPGKLSTPSIKTRGK